MQMNTLEPIACYETIVGERRVAIRQVVDLTAEKNRLLKITTQAHHILSKLDAAQIFDELALEDRRIIADFCKSASDALNDMTPQAEAEPE